MQASPEAKVVDVVEIVQPALVPAARVMSVESVCARPLAAMLPVLVTVPVRVVVVLVPKLTLVRLRGISSNPVCAVSAAYTFPDGSAATPAAVVSDIPRVVLGPLTRVFQDTLRQCVCSVEITCRVDAESDRGDVGSHCCLRAGGIDRVDRLRSRIGDIKVTAAVERKRDHVVEPRRDGGRQDSGCALALAIDRFAGAVVDEEVAVRIDGDRLRRCCCAVGGERD